VGRCSAVGIASVYGWAVQGSIPGGGEIYAPLQIGPGAHPASCTIGTGSFLRVKRPRRGIDHLPPCSAEVKVRGDLYIHTHSRPF
jgi:hypothetical protein